jgi:tRNA pseudouridine55 synthase
VSSGLLLVDKQAGDSSHRVVAIARKALETREVGHAGTLDPAATGLLVLAVGECLKLLRYLVLDHKRYRATIMLGEQTDTLDVEGEVILRADVPAELDVSRVQRAASTFVGSFLQRAPEHSALKLRGVPLYRRVRRGESVQAPEREVLLHSIEVLSVQGAQIELELHCGKGFYVRSLARDLANALGTVGHLSALRRITSGPFNVEGAVSMAQLRSAASGDTRAREDVRACMLEKERVLMDAPRAVLTEAGVRDAAHGRPVVLEEVQEASIADLRGEPILLFDSGGSLVALARREDDCLRIVRGFR